MFAVEYYRDDKQQGYVVTDGINKKINDLVFASKEKAKAFADRLNALFPKG